MAATLDKILEELQGLKKQTKELSKDVSEIKDQTKELSKDVSEIKDNVRKIMKFVSTENADFEVKIKKSHSTYTPAATQQRLAAKPQK